MERRPRSGRLATAIGIALLPVVVLGVLTASNVVSLRALTQLTGITPLIEAVTELRLQAGTQVSESAELAVAVFGGALFLGAVVWARWRRNDTSRNT